MGKNLISQRRGKGSSTFRAKSFAFAGKASHPAATPEDVVGTVKELLHSAGHSAPLARISLSNGEECLMMAPLGITVGSTIRYGLQIEPSIGNTLPLSALPEGTLVYNIESRPGDGGKFARASGTFGRVLSKIGNSVLVMLPSKKEKLFSPNCRATVGVVAGGGRLEKPLLKAGANYHKFKAKNRYYPRVCALSMNAVSHPFGGSRSSKKGKVTIAPRNAPPGRKVGMIRPRRSGRRR